MILLQLPYGKDKENIDQIGRAAPFSPLFRPTRQLAIFLFSPWCSSWFTASMDEVGLGLIHRDVNRDGSFLVNRSANASCLEEGRIIDKKCAARRQSARGKKPLSVVRDP
jgi:hypothetical protein